MSPYNQDAVERIARAIYESRDARMRYNREDLLLFAEIMVLWDQIPGFVQDSYRDDARAALDAIDRLYSEDEQYG